MSTTMFTSKLFCNLRTRPVSVRLKYKRVPKENEKSTGITKALQHFDEFYKKVYSKQWTEIRSALLGTRKYIAVLNYYGDIEDTKDKLERLGAVNIRRMFEVEKEQLLQRSKNHKRQTLLTKIKSMADESGNKIANANDLQENNSDTIPQEYKSPRIFDTRNLDTAGILYEFVPSNKIKGREDFIEDETEFYAHKPQKQERFINITKEYSMNFPKHLEAYCFVQSKVEFEAPVSGSTGVLNYYLMDGGSLLPVLALDLEPRNCVLDLCAAPGGKSFIALQTLYPESLVANDMSISRSKRIDNVFKQYFYNYPNNMPNIRIQSMDGRYLTEHFSDLFDRILVDVPCTTDRHSVIEEDNNIFKASRIKERLQLPKYQSALLKSALTIVKPGGVVVYSTCTLSPLQNDGVVHMALKSIWEESKIEVSIVDWSEHMKQFKSIYNFVKPGFCKYGQLILPNADQNYGPTYFCKLRRIK